MDGQISEIGQIISDRIAAFESPEGRFGATYAPGQGGVFRLWAPYLKEVELLYKKAGGRGNDFESYPMDGPFDVPGCEGMWTYHMPGAGPGDLYMFRSREQKPFADPASRYQPEGVFGASELVAQDYEWTDSGWRGIPTEEWVVYELHPGTFTSEGTFEGILRQLPRLRDLGVTTLEIMPVSQFPGERNWGYDGVFPHAVQNTYGRPEDLKRLVDQAHAHGLAIILDVVYNHLGPEGNVLYQCAPFVQDKYRTPWGDALNYDGSQSDPVRQYFLQTAWQWLTEYHFDGLRLDAVQTIFDTAPVPFLEELALVKRAAEQRMGRRLTLIAETDMNDPRILLPSEDGGMNMCGNWNDDLHHCLHALLTGERNGYYQDYGAVEQLARIYARGVAFEGEYSQYRGRRHGRPYTDVDRRRLVAQAQNHDQIGNRAYGDRLAANLPEEKIKLAASCVFLSPFMPLMFMGEEWAAKNPFIYFVDHQSPNLIVAVQEGRKREFAAFLEGENPPDPASEAEWRTCVLTSHPGSGDPVSGHLVRMYKELIALSRDFRRRDLFHPGTFDVSCDPERGAITMLCGAPGARHMICFSFSDEVTGPVKPDIDERTLWTILFRSSDYQPSSPANSGPQPGSPISLETFSLKPWSASVLMESPVHD